MKQHMRYYLIWRQACRAAFSFCFLYYFNVLCLDGAFYQIKMLIKHTCVMCTESGTDVVNTTHFCALEAG